MKANRSEDVYFLNLVADGVFTITKNGEIYDTVKKNFIHKSLVGGYHRVNYNCHAIQAHRLIWMAFNGLIPKGLQINHKDGDKINNEVDNLELATNSQNTKHAYNIGLSKISEEHKIISSKMMLGEKNINSKISEADVKKVRQRYQKREITFEYIKNKYNMSRRAVENMLLGRSYKHIPYELKKL